MCKLGAVDTIEEAVEVMRKAKRLKRMTFTHTDPNLQQKLAQIHPFLKRFSPRMGLSSEDLFTTLCTGDARYARFQAIDFDDWCRCLHKMSLFPTSVLEKCLCQLQQTNHFYARLLHNLSHSVYICLLYWCVPPHFLSEMVRRASLNKSKYIELLTVDNVCTIQDWTTVPSMSWPWSMHSASCAQVFSKAYDSLVRYEMEPFARVCCSIVPKFSRLKRAWDRRSVVLGQRIDIEKLHSDDLEDIFDRLTMGGLRSYTIREYGVRRTGWF